MNRIVSVAELKRHLSEVLGEVAHAQQSVLVTRLKDVPPGRLWTSTICVMELWYGCARKRDQTLWERIHRELLVHVGVLPFGQNEATISAQRTRST